jgi:hypothetical protein
MIQFTNCIDATRGEVFGPTQISSREPRRESNQRESLIKIPAAGQISQNINLNAGHRIAKIRDRRQTPR